VDTSRLLRLARERAGYSQSLLARLSGVAQPKVSAYESGRESPTTRTLTRLLDACGADVRLTGTRIPEAFMDRGARRSLEIHKRIAAGLLTDDETRLNLVRRASEVLVVARAKNPFGGLWHDWWSELLEGPLDELIAKLVGEDSHSIELRANSPFVGAAVDEQTETVGNEAR